VLFLCIGETQKTLIEKSKKNCQTAAKNLVGFFAAAKR